MRVLSEADVAARLALDNPWWDRASEPGRAAAAEIAALPRRAFFDGLAAAVERRGPPLLLAGSRRVGKSVLMRQVIGRLIDAGVAPRSIQFIALDAPATHGMALEDLVRALRARAQAPAGPGFLFLDGAQARRDLDPALARLALAYPDARIVAAISGGPAPRPREREGGLPTFVLPPLTFAEYLRLIGAERDLIEPMFFGKGARAPIYVVRDAEALNQRFLHYLNGGGFPEAVLLRPNRGEAAAVMRGEVLGALLRQDLPGLTGIASTAELNALFTLIAGNIGREVSIEAMAERARVAKNTIRRYLDYLEAAFLIVRMGRVHPEGERFLRMRTFKIHLASPCLRAALFGPVDAGDPHLPALAQSAVVSQWLGSPELRNLAYARLPEGPLDLIGLSPDTGRPSWACALPGDDDVSDNSINGLIEFSKRNGPLRWLGATTHTRAALKRHDGVEVWHRPTAQYCYEIGRRVAEEAAAF